MKDKGPFLVTENTHFLKLRGESGSWAGISAYQSDICTGTALHGAGPGSFPFDLMQGSLEGLHAKYFFTSLSQMPAFDIKSLCL